MYTKRQKKHKPMCDPCLAGQWIIWFDFSGVEWECACW